MSDNNGWSRYEKLVLHELTRLSNAVEVMSKDITKLKIRAGAWGALAGMVSGAVILLARII